VERMVYRPRAPLPGLSRCRLRPEALAVRLQDKSIAEFAARCRFEVGAEGFGR